jgi:hypothetical protein
LFFSSAAGGAGGPRAAALDRTRVRNRFDERFSAARMTRDYLSVYRALGRFRALKAV